MPTTLEIVAYTFDELLDHAKEKARAWFRDTVISSDSIMEHYRYTLGELGYPTSDISFSLGYCQGDGMAFFGPVDLPQFLTRRLEAERAVPEFVLSASRKEALECLRLRLPDPNPLRCTLLRNSFGYRYSHDNTMHVSLDLDESREDVALLEPVADALQDWIAADVREISKTLEDAGYAIMEADTSDVQIDEDIRANEYLFTEHGSRAYVL